MSDTGLQLTRLSCLHSISTDDLYWRLLSDSTDQERQDVADELLRRDLPQEHYVRFFTDDWNDTALQKRQPNLSNYVAKFQYVSAKKCLTQAGILQKIPIDATFDAYLGPLLESFALTEQTKELDKECFRQWMLQLHLEFSRSDWKFLEQCFLLLPNYARQLVAFLTPTPPEDIFSFRYLQRLSAERKRAVWSATAILTNRQFFGKLLPELDDRRKFISSFFSAPVDKSTAEFFQHQVQFLCQPMSEAEMTARLFEAVSFALFETSVNLHAVEEHFLVNPQVAQLLRESESLQQLWKIQKLAHPAGVSSQELRARLQSPSMNAALKAGLISDTTSFDALWQRTSAPRHHPRL